MTIDELEKLIHLDVDNRFKEYEEGGEPVPPEPPPDGTVVSTTQELITALAVGGDITLAEGVEFYNPTGFTVRSNTRLMGRATLKADNQPAIWVKPGSTNIVLQGMTCLSTRWTG